MRNALVLDCIGCVWHGTQEYTVFRWNLVFSSLYFILWLRKKHTHETEICNSLGPGTWDIVQISLLEWSPRWFVPHLWSSQLHAKFLCVCVCQKKKKQPIETEGVWERGRERERESAVVSFYIMPTLQIVSNGFPIFTIPFGPLSRPSILTHACILRSIVPQLRRSSQEFELEESSRDEFHVCVYVYVYMYI